jgi:hypothetical protein
MHSSSNGCARFVSGKLSTQIDGSPALSAPHEFAATPRAKGSGAGVSAPDYCERRATAAATEAPERVESNLVAEGHHSASLDVAERYKVQFTATEEYVRLVEDVKALLSHAVPNVTLEELHLRAMRALVAELKKRKYAAVESARTPRPASSMRREHTHPLDRDPKQSGTDALAQTPQRMDALPQADEWPYTRWRGRHIPAAVRRTVFERDSNRCSYVDPNGARCPETHRLEFHHLKPFATGGDHRTSNLTLRCAAHNAIAAEEDFGPELIQDRKTSRQHESFRSFRG